MTTTQVSPATALLSELNDLKRVRTAGDPASLAERGFARSWSALCGGAGVRDVTLTETAAALIAARLGGYDRAALGRCGVAAADADAVLLRGFDAVAGQLHEGIRHDLRDAARRAPATGAQAPAFVGALTDQPRAGATRPGQPRLVLQPTESHADHCMTVAVYSVVLAPQYGADPARPFLAGLAHHLHNATMPDAGYAGDELLGKHVAPMMAQTTALALAQLPAALRAETESALQLVGNADTPEAQAFNAADVLDRVLEMRQHARQAAFTLDVALGELELVHPGPLQSFGLDVLAQAGLLDQ